MKELKEIKYLRTEREKHYLKSDGTMIAEVFPDQVHYLHRGKYEEIDNTLETIDNYAVNKKNTFKTRFNIASKEKELFHVEKDNYYLTMYIKDQHEVQASIFDHHIQYQNILNDIDINYDVLPSKVKESIILNNKNNIPKKIQFIVDTNLEVKKNGENIVFEDENQYTVFTIDSPYMVDMNQNYHNKIYYELEHNDSFYVVSLILDEKWLEAANFPILIDPTITSSGQNKNVYDTYIYQGDTTVNRNNQDVLKIGVEKTNNQIVKNRSLVKFDLPTIGTGSQVIEAEAVLVGYGVLNPNVKKDIIAVHNINTNWNEETANWNTMHDKYDEKIEDYVRLTMSTSILGDVTDVAFNRINITNLVKHWYSGTPNYGFMLKSYHEQYQSDIPVAKCFSKNNTVQGYNPKPYLIIHYRNQNGLEDYMEYEEHEFTNGAGYFNLYNGNLTELFQIGSTIGGKFPIKLEIIYNTNDVILNHNYGYGLGFKLNMHQEIKKITIEDNTLLEYLDADGTLHYFYRGSDLNIPDKDPNLYYDEDGLSLTIEENGDNYLMKDSIGNCSLFVKNGTIWYLKELTDTNHSKIVIYYDTSNRIIKIMDANNSEIQVVYAGDSIIVNSPSDVVTLHYQNKQLNRISSIMGITTIDYDKNNLISRVMDINGMSVKYDYYSQIPYRLAKLTEYGQNDKIGKYFQVKYEFNVTVLTDEKGRMQIYTFNHSGNNVGIVNTDQNENIKRSYGKQTNYYKIRNEDIGTGKVNKPVSDKTYVKTVKNYIRNSSFEENIPVTFSTSKLTETIVDDTAVTGKHSLKLSTPFAWKMKTMQFQVPKGNYYTFSTYMKNDCDLLFTLYYDDSDNQRNHTYISFPHHDVFTRSSLTIFYPETAISELFLEITFMEQGTLYIDDLQLEEGETASLYNMISNSNFEDGLKNWDIKATRVNDPAQVEIDSKASIVNLDHGITALKLIGEPDKSEILTRTIPISGKKGDLFDLYFWYKNHGIMTQYGPVSRHALVSFQYVEGAPTIDTFPQIALHTDNEKWQLFHSSFGAVHDYNSIQITIFNVESVNELYLTGFSLFKAIGQDNFMYDNFGNLKEYNDSQNQIYQYEYDKNNQLVSMTDKQGKQLIYEYDHVIPDRIFRGISATGITSETEYDEFGNITVNRIFNTGTNLELTSENYYIREMGTHRFLTPDMINFKITSKENACSHYSWRLEKVNDIYKILSVDLPSYGISHYKSKIILSNRNLTNFVLLKNKNGSYSIKVEDQPLYVTIVDQHLELSSYVKGSHNQQFYFEKQASKLFIESKNTFTSDGKFVKTITDSLGRETQYTIEPTTGLVQSVIDPKGGILTYTYNDKKQLQKTEKGTRTVVYQYNDQTLLSDIIFGNKQYHFDYDEFLNTKQISLGEHILITNSYEENNGNLLSTTYANQDKISYVYDDFDQLKKETTMDQEYLYYYNNLGDVSKIISISDQYDYDYDALRRLTEYKNNRFQVNYTYGNDDIILKRNYQVDGLKKTIDYEYNNDDNITKITNDNVVIDCIYDELGRTKEKSINNYKINYDYITKGYKSSFVLDRFQNQDNEFKYCYDNINNITDIYHNGKLINHYDYNEHNELIRDIDYKRKVEINYYYDNVGNLLLKQTYDIDSDTILKTDSYEYHNVYWEDQLTKYNDIEITYDAIGNPVMIGDAHLTWKNGRQLSGYQSENLDVTYQYNIESIRTSKIVNGDETKYYLEDDRIIFEKNRNYVLYYIRDNNDELVGFQHNDDMYYYLKNGQGDIIGLLDERNQQIAKYQYDVWGNIIKVTDALDHVITDMNHIAHINPFRYRGYYYDQETNLYYLNSRYYNPVWGRFINADSLLGNMSEISYNLYSYGGNNPITNGDPDGDIGFFLGCLIVGAAAGFISHAVVGAAKSKQKYNKVKPKEVLKEAVKGTVIGAAVGAAVGAVGKAVIKYVTTGTPQKVGKIGERMSGIWKNSGKHSFKIQDKAGVMRTRIPDKYIKNKSIMEVKNVKKLSLTQQIRDYQTISQQVNNGIDFILKTRSDTILSKPLQEFIRKHNIIVRHLPW